MDGWFDELLNAVPFSFGRIVNFALVGGFGSAIPAALIAGSGGSGSGFHEGPWIAMVASAAVVSAIVGGVTGRRSRSD